MMNPSCRVIHRSRLILHLVFAGYLLLLCYLALFASVLSKCTSGPWLQIKNTLCQYHRAGFRILCAVELLWSAYAFYLSLLCHRWLARQLDYDLYDACERAFSVMRKQCIAGLAATTILLVLNKDLHRYSKVGVLALLHLLPLGICAYHTFLRKTFREWPDFILTLSACLEYLAWTILPYPNHLILGFLDGRVYVAMFSRVTFYLASGTILAALGGMILESVKGKIGSELEKEESRDPTSRNARLRLLLHTPARPGQIRNAVLKVSWAASLYMVICCLSVLLPLAVLSRDSMPPADANTETAPPTPPLSCYLGTLGFCAGAMGIAAHFTISEDSMLKSEYFYLYFRARDLKKQDILQQSDNWKDYCQVAANAYCSHSGIISDDHYFHHLWEPALRQLKEHLQICDSQFLADIVYAQMEVCGKREAGNPASPLLDNQCIATDTHSFLRNNSPIQDSPRLLCTLRYAAKHLFANQMEWERRLRVTPYTFEESVSILLYDVFHMLLHQKSPEISGCRAAAFCSGGSCGYTCPCPGDAAVRRAELVLSFPLLIRKCMQARWQGVDIRIPDDISEYYARLVDDPPEGIADVGTLETIRSEWVSSVRALLPDQAAAFLNAPLGCVCSQKHTQSIDDSTYQQAARIRAAQMRIVESGDSLSPHAHLREEPMQLDSSRRLVYYVFYTTGAQSSPLTAASHGAHAGAAPVP